MLDRATNDGPPILVYERRHHRHLPARALVFGAFAAVACLIVWRERSPLQLAAGQIADLHRQRQYVAYTQPGDRCVYDGDHPTGSTSPTANGWPGSWRAFMGGKYFGSMDGMSYEACGAEGPLVYLHRCSSPAGERLVAVWQDDVGGFPPLNLAAECFVPGTWTRPAETHGSHGRWHRAIPLGVHSPLVVSGLRIFAGQPDPSDRSHFAIRYVLHGQPGIVDGWVTADGRDVRLTDRTTGRCLAD